jgi:hypothetical protein
MDDVNGRESEIRDEVGVGTHGVLHIQIPILDHVFDNLDDGVFNVAVSD